VYPFDLLRRTREALSRLGLRSSIYVAEFNYKRLFAWVLGIWLVIAALYYAFLSPEAESRRFRELELTVGRAAEETAAVVLDSLEPCTRLGHANLVACAATDSLLPTERAIAAAAGKAVERKRAYDRLCQDHFDAQYCADLVNRAANTINATRRQQR